MTESGLSAISVNCISETEGPSVQTGPTLAQPRPDSIFPVAVVADLAAARLCALVHRHLFVLHIRQLGWQGGSGGGGGGGGTVRRTVVVLCGADLACVVTPLFLQVRLDDAAFDV
jgi:hypothetical protein